MLGVLAFLAAACSSQPTGESQAAEDVAAKFIEEYDSWAQGGYSRGLPEALQDISAGPILDTLTSDARWYSEAGIQQVGAMEIIDLESLNYTSQETTVLVTLNPENISYTSFGEAVEAHHAETQTIELSLTHDGQWKVSQIEIDKLGQ